MSSAGEQKVWRICGVDYVAAPDKETAINCWMETCEGDRPDDDEVEVLTEAEMRRFKFYEEETVYDENDEPIPPKTPPCTFEEHLNKMLKSGEKFPVFFASSEY